MLKYLLFLLMALSFSLPVKATTVAFDGKILASDGQTTAGTMRMESGPKIHYIKRAGVYIGCAGTVSDIISLLRHLEEGTPLPKDYTGDVEAIVVDKDGNSLLLLGDEQHMKVQHAPFAIGSGAPAAIAAMMSGANAIEAVYVAEHVDIYSSGDIFFIPIGTEQIKCLKPGS
jgi:ATP-dependent protease HslVU (ClpYQ) peptidase subunit